MLYFLNNGSLHLEILLSNQQRIAIIIDGDMKEASYKTKIGKETCSFRR